MNPPKLFELKLEDVEALLERVEKGTLQDGDYALIRSMVETIAYLSQSVDEKATSIKRLLRMIFGASTETREKIIDSKKKPEDTTEKPVDPKPPAKGHGKNGADAYKNADRIEVPIEDMKAGDPCAECPNGKVYPVKESGVLVRFLGMAPLAAKVYDLEKFRCSSCGVVITAQAPGDIGSQKYDETAGAMIAVLKYGSGVPFNRIEKLQENLGIPLPASTQWDIVENAADRIHPAFSELIRQAAQGNVIHNDDTPMKILELAKELNDKSARKGIFTTGMMSIAGERKIALFFTGHKHAGENMTDLLRQRQSELEPPIQMCDALSRNLPKDFLTILSNCLVHGRRNFVDIVANFPNETAFVIEQISIVYRNDEITRSLSCQERLIFHQRESAPVMENLKSWLSDQLDQKKTEPNSGLGKAIAYMLRHWEALTLFLRVAGAPLDNNICERALKKVILHRKNSLFYKTTHGAFIGDMFMSLIHTCNLGDVNPFDYLTALQKNTSEVFKNPGNWMPWNYESSLPVKNS